MIIKPYASNLLCVSHVSRIAFKGYAHSQEIKNQNNLNRGCGIKKTMGHKHDGQIRRWLPMHEQDQS